MRVSGVVVARDEEATIAEVLAAARPHVDELIVVDGHSRDKTVEIAKSLGARVILDEKRGKGQATRAGIEAATGELVLLMTADGQDDYAAIPRLLEPLRDGRADLVVGSRFLGGSEEFSATPEQLVRTTGNITLNVLINLRWGTDLTDVLNGLRAGRREELTGLGLSEDSAAVEVEMVAAGLLKGLRVINVPTHEYARRVGETRLSVWPEGARIYACLLKHLVSRASRPGPTARRDGPPAKP